MASKVDVYAHGLAATSQGSLTQQGLSSCTTNRLAHHIKKFNIKTLTLC